MVLLKNSEQINIENSETLLKTLQCKGIFTQNQLGQNGQHAEMYAFSRAF